MFFNKNRICSHMSESFPSIFNVNRIWVISSLSGNEENWVNRSHDLLFASIWVPNWFRFWIHNCKLVEHSRVYKSAHPKWPKVYVTSVVWILKASCTLQLLMTTFLSLLCWTNCLSDVNSDTSKCGKIEKDNLWLTSGNHCLFYVLTWTYLLTFLLVIGQALISVLQVQLRQHKLVRTAASSMVCVLLYHDVSHTTSHPSLSGVAWIVP